MIKYELNGETISIAPIDEEQFKLDNPEAKKLSQIMFIQSQRKIPKK